MFGNFWQCESVHSLDTRPIGHDGFMPDPITLAGSRWRWWRRYEKKKESKLANHFCTYLLEHEVSISAYYSRLVGGFTPEKYQLGWVIIHEFHDDIPNKNGKIWKNLIQSCSSHQPAILCCVDTWLMHSKITCWEARPTVSPMDSPQSSAMRLRWSFFHWPQPMMSVDRICNTYRYWYIYIYIYI